jgi:hypothetical protein
MEPAPHIAPEEVIMEIPLPILEPNWPTPIEKAKILLESASEIEHALMVQYLYAAYSLKSSNDSEDGIIDPAQKPLLDERKKDSWFRVLVGIAREEMGHLMSVQNLLLFVWLPPNFEREDFPPRKDIYPFKLHLEPLSQTSLAKYVVAESALDQSNIEDIKTIAMGAERGTMINHVGILYGLLGLVFSTQEQVRAGGSGDAGWDLMLRDIWKAAMIQNSNPDVWHLPESAFHMESVQQQGEPSDWQMPGPTSGLRVHRLASRDEARSAIRDIAEQGEGPTAGDMTSHFMRFESIYRKVYPEGAAPSLPSLETWATRAVPVDPKPSDFTEMRTRRWAELADARYALLLGFLEHYLLTTGDDRQLLTGWIFSEMRSRLGYIARLLTKMPRGDGGVAAVPFTLPEGLHLPAKETERWALHKQRTEFAIATIGELQAVGGADASDEFLKNLLSSDEARLVFMIARVEAPMQVTTSFARDIMPLFRPVDIEHMIDIAGLDLSAYKTAKSEAQNILDHVKGPAGRMPPPPDFPWTIAQINLLQRWKNEGFPK